MTGPERVYPLPYEEDYRFTHGLVDEVVSVLIGHGYPPLNGLDLAALQQALYAFLYALDQR